MSKKVLFWDNTISHSTGSQLLIKEGYEVDTVHNADIGLRQLGTQDYGIIIVKESLEAESWQICKKFRYLSDLPLIVISTNASADTCVKAIHAGADYFLRKPFGPLELIARVKSLLQRTYLNQPVRVGA